jgi:hypothetical protein
MLKRYSALVLLLVLQSTAASAQCWDSSSLKSARSANSKAATEYSTCLEDQARVENQVRVQSQARGENAARGENQASQYCKDEYSNLQSAKHDLETAPSQNTRVRARTVVSSRMAVFPFSARLRSPPVGVSCAARYFRKQPTGAGNSGPKCSRRIAWASN